MLHEQDTRHRPAPAQWLRVDRLSGPVPIASLRLEWDELLEASDAGLFNAWEWLSPWMSRIAPEREPWIFTVRDRSGRLEGLLPLAMEQRKVLGRSVRRLA